MAGQIKLDSVGALEELSHALASFAADCAEGVESGAADIERRGGLLEERCRELARRVEYWQEEYDSADEDEELSHIARRLREAEDDYERARSWLRRVEEAASDYARAAARARELSSHDIPEACAFLRQKISELREYVAARPGEVGGKPSSPASLAAVLSTGAASVRAASAAAAVEGAGDASAKISLSDFPLPRGFKWVRLNDLDPHELGELPAREDFRKVPYEVMRKGLGVLKDEVLPAIRELGARADREYFRQLDAEKGADPQCGALKVFDSFFGHEFKEYARVERFAGAPHYGITNGRHRIKVALDLGWDAIPAEAVEVGRNS